MTLKREINDTRSYEELLEDVDAIKKEFKMYRRRTNRIFDLCPVAMLVIHSETGGILKMNHLACRITGIKDNYSPGTLFHQDLFINKPLQFPVAYNTAFNRYYEDRISLDDGRIMHALRQFVPFESDGIPCILEIITDISSLNNELDTIEKWTEQLAPSADDKQPDTVLPTETGCAAMAGDNKDIKILVVDDSRMMRKILTKLLQESGYNQIIAYANGVEALAGFHQSGADLIISDWNMPKMNGLEFLKKIREGSYFSNVPFVMATAEGLKSNLADAKKAGVTDYITKPFNGNQIHSIIQALFQPAQD